MAPPENPYNSPGANADDALRENPPQSHGKRMLIGFLIGAALPLAAAVFTMFQSRIHVESNPLGGFVSGAVPFSVLLLIFIASPLLGIVGAIASRFLGPSRET